MPSPPHSEVVLHERRTDRDGGQHCDGTVATLLSGCLMEVSPGVPGGASGRGLARLLCDGMRLRLELPAPPIPTWTAWLERSVGLHLDPDMPAAPWSPSPRREREHAGGHRRRSPQARPQ